MAEVVFRGVNKHFGSVCAVSNLNLVIADGEFITLLGPSGCGKTTTLNLTAGLEYPDEGEILIGGIDVTGKSPGNRNVAMAFQNYALYPHKTVYENLAFPLRARGRSFSPTDIENKVQQIAGLLDIGVLLSRMPRELSGGQQQRVSIGRCLIRDPNAFLLDEPLSNLDARLRLRMRAELKRLHGLTGGTFVYVTHDQAEAMTLSSRIALFNEGALQQVGTPEELYNSPKNAFVAGFLGERELNIVSAHLTTQNGSREFVGDGFGIPGNRFVEHANGQYDQHEFRLGIRAEDVEIVTVPAHAHGAAPVTLVEPMGSHRFVHLGLGTQETAIVCRVPSSFRVQVGESVHFRFARAFVFDSQNDATVGFLT